MTPADQPSSDNGQSTTGGAAASESSAISIKERLDQADHRLSERDRDLESLERKRTTSVTPIESTLVFVAMSFEEEMDPIYEGVKNAAKSARLEAKRVKDIQDDDRITDRTFHMIRTSRLVLADLTHERPNIYFELGYARGLGKSVVTIARKGTIIHFNAYDWECIFYVDSRPLEKDLKRWLQAWKRKKSP